MSKFTIDAILGFSNDSVSKNTEPPKITPKPRTRRGRTAFSDEAIDRLEDVFMVNRYPDINLRETLAQKLGVAESRIQVWFQNRRSRGRRNKPRSRDTSLVSPESKIKEESGHLSYSQALHQPHNLVYSHPYPYHNAGYNIPIIPQMNYYPMPSYGFPMMANSGYVYPSIPHGAINSMPLNHVIMVHPQVTSTPNTSPSIKHKLQGINMLTEAARKLSSSSYTEYDLRHSESFNDTTLGSSISVKSDSQVADTSSSSVSSIPSDDSSRVSCVGEEESGDEDQLFIDV